MLRETSLKKSLEKKHFFKNKVVRFQVQQSIFYWKKVLKKIGKSFFYFTLKLQEKMLKIVQG